MNKEKLTEKEILIQIIDILSNDEDLKKLAEEDSIKDYPEVKTAEVLDFLVKNNHREAINNIWDFTRNQLEEYRNNLRFIIDTFEDRFDVEEERELLNEVNELL